MKNLIILTLIALLVGATTASTAKADREGRALIGGLIGGLIIGSVLDDDRHHGHHRNSSHRRYDDHCGCSGHYDYVSVRTWINGRWSIHYDRCGQRQRDWRPGHYSHVKKRVWVPHSRGCRHYSSPRHDDHYSDHGRGHSRRRY